MGLFWVIVTVTDFCVLTLERGFYLSPTEMLKVMHGDQVIVKIYPGREKQRTDAVILEVVKRAQQDLVGRLVLKMVCI